MATELILGRAGEEQDDVVDGGSQPQAKMKDKGRDIQVPLPNIERCRAFWTLEETDRPLLACWIGSYQFPDLFPIGLSSMKQGQLTPDDVIPQAFAQDFENLFDLHRQVPADVPWSSFPLVLIPWAEAIAGCPVVHRDGTVWAERWPLESENARGEDVRPDRDWLAKLVEFIEWLKSLSDGRFPVAMSLLRGPADLLAAIRGAENSVLNLYDDGETTERLLNALADLWIYIALAQLEHLPRFADGYAWSVQNLWSDEPGCWFQDDAIAFWSPRLHQRYAAPLERRLSRCLKRTGCHLHSAALFTVDELLTMEELGVIEINIDLSGKSVADMIPVFRRVLEQQRLYLWGRFSADDLHLMRRELPTRGLALQLMAESPAEVREMIVEVEQTWKG